MVQSDKLLRVFCLAFFGSVTLVATYLHEMGIAVMTAALFVVFLAYDRSSE